MRSAPRGFPADRRKRGNPRPPRRPCRCTVVPRLYAIYLKDGYDPREECRGRGERRSRRPAAPRDLRRAGALRRAQSVEGHRGLDRAGVRRDRHRAGAADHDQRVQFPAQQLRVDPRAGPAVAGLPAAGARHGRRRDHRVLEAGLNARHIRNILAVAPGPVSPNKLVQTAFVAMDNSIVNGSGTAAGDAIKVLRADIKPLMTGTGLSEGVTGSAAEQLDSQQSSQRAQQIVLLATLVLILVLLLVIFRSPVIALLPLVVIALVSQVAT